MDSKYISSDIQTYTFPELKDTLASDQAEETDQTLEKTEEMDEVSLREEKKQEAFKSSGFSETGESILNEVVGEHQKSDEEKINLSENYKSHTFITEHSLLTSAESYSETIREGAKLYADHLNTEAEKLYAEAKQIKEEAEAIQQSAQNEKEKLLAQAEMEKAQIFEQARQEGFVLGEQQGIQNRYDEAYPKVQNFDRVIEQMYDLRNLIRFQGEQELVQLALLIAKNVVLAELNVNQDVIYNIVKSAIREIENLGKIRIFLNQEDYEFIKNSQSELEKYIKEDQTLVMKSSIDLVAGEILIETDENTINYTFEKQFEAIEEALNRRLSERQATLHNVDMDQYDFNPQNLPSDDLNRQMVGEMESQRDQSTLEIQEPNVDSTLESQLQSDIEMNDAEEVDIHENPMDIHASVVEKENYE